MTDRLKMSDPLTSLDLLSAISSLDLGHGRWLCVMQNGRIVDQCGQQVARASLSARQAKALGLLTSGTYGPPSTGLSKSADLQFFLESRLRANLQGLGSTLYTLTWKPWVTPSGVSRFRLRASVRRTSETERTGQQYLEIDGTWFPVEMFAPWPTPTTRDWKDGSYQTKVELNGLLGAGGLVGRMADNDDHGCLAHAGAELHDTEHHAQSCGCAGGVADLQGERWNGRQDTAWQGGRTCIEAGCIADRPGPTNGYWRAADWLGCTDGKWRPVEPGSFPLAGGAPARVGRLRAYGNAINPEQAKVFIKTIMELGL